MAVDSARVRSRHSHLIALLRADEPESHACPIGANCLGDHGCLTISLSVGTAIIEAMLSVDEALERADRNMYEAKQVAHRSDRPGAFRRNETGEVNECGKAPRAA